ncbi:MAG: HutD family protein [Clostridiaceae bacterium]
MTLIQIKPEDFKVTAWSGGITEEIWIDPLEANFSKRDFICRISTAVVEADQSIFTKLSDYNRFIAPLNGSLSLTIEGAAVELEPFEVFEFDGSCDVRSHARPGLRDLNLMIRKGCRGNLKIMSSALTLDPLQVQVVLIIQLDPLGRYLDIGPAFFKPQGISSQNIEWSGDVAKGDCLFAVFTIPQ